MIPCFLHVFLVIFQLTDIIFFPIQRVIEKNIFRLSMVQNTELFLRTSFSQFKKNNLDFVVLRNYEDYPKSLPKPDIGLLISPDHQGVLIRSFREVCSTLGYLLSLKFRSFNIITLEALQPGHDAEGNPMETSIKIDARTYEVFKYDDFMKKFSGFNYKVFFSMRSKNAKSTRMAANFMSLTNPTNVSFY